MVALASGCTHGTGTTPEARTPSSTGTTPPATGSARVCPVDYAAPDPHRPRIRLRYDVAAGLDTLRGVEEVQFTPDLPVREVVFRLTANGPTATHAGTSIRVDRAEADGRSGARYQRAGADPRTQGGLLVIPLGRQVPAGRSVTARVEFTLTLGRASFDRFGHTSSVAWWGSGQPLLAWERGVGWHREPLLDFPGESATSETARVDLTVVAPAADTVVSSGRQDPPRDTGDGHRSWHATADTARDVSVAVGRLRTATATDAGTRITAAAADQRTASALRDQAESALDALRARFGRYPYPELNVTELSGRTEGGIEYPGSVLLFGLDRTVTVHEVAHQWFYGMVGDSQARDPWLDEAFASYAEQLVDGQRPDRNVLSVPGRVDTSTAAITGGGDEYFRLVYGKGAAALWAARDAAGAERFDTAVGCYLRANAWRIAQPSDLATALAGLPRALAVLRHAGAL